MRNAANHIPAWLFEEGARGVASRKDCVVDAYEAIDHYHDWSRCNDLRTRSSAPSQKGGAMLRVSKYFAKSFKLAQVRWTR